MHKRSVNIATLCRYVGKKTRDKGKSNEGNRQLHAVTGTLFRIRLRFQRTVVQIAYSMKTKPAETPRKMTTRPYDRPNPIASARTSITWTLPLSAVVAVSLVEAAPKPVYTADAPEVAPVSPVAVADIVDIVEVLILVGFCAPHGWAVRHWDWHTESDFGQLLTHWLALSVHS